MLAAHLVPLHAVCHLVSHSSLFKADIIKPIQIWPVPSPRYIVCKWKGWNQIPGLSIANFVFFSLQSLFKRLKMRTYSFSASSELALKLCLLQSLDMYVRETQIFLWSVQILLMSCPMHNTEFHSQLNPKEWCRA